MMKSVLILDEFFAMTAKIRTLFLSHIKITNYLTLKHGTFKLRLILCKSADKAYVEYIMQDFRQPMGVATYKTADEMDEELMKVLPPKEELEKLLNE